MIYQHSNSSTGEWLGFRREGDWIIYDELKDMIDSINKNKREIHWSKYDWEWIGLSPEIFQILVDANDSLIVAGALPMRHEYDDEKEDTSMVAGLGGPMRRRTKLEELEFLENKLEDKLVKVRRAKEALQKNPQVQEVLEALAALGGGL